MIDVDVIPVHNVIPVVHYNVIVQPNMHELEQKVNIFTTELGVLTTELVTQAKTLSNHEIELGGHAQQMADLKAQIQTRQNANPQQTRQNANAQQQSILSLIR